MRTPPFGPRRRVPCGFGPVPEQSSVGAFQFRAARDAEGEINVIEGVSDAIGSRKERAFRVPVQFEKPPGLRVLEQDPETSAPNSGVPPLYDP